MSDTPDVIAPCGSDRRSPTHAGHAVVVGGGMTGLLAARVLASHFGQVTLIERDALPEGVQARKGVPQSRMLHVMQPRGQGIIERLFPGCGHELEAAGAVSLRVPADALILSPAGWLDRRASGWPLLSASRPLLERALRRRLRELPGVTILDRHDVTSLLTSRDGRHVTGVTLRPLDGAGGPAYQLGADLVVDTGGRGSRAATWLSEAGYATPTKTHVDPNAAHACRTYRIPDGFSADWRMVMLTSQPPSIPRTGYLFPIEDGQWMVTLVGAAGQHPPTDEDGFAAFARSLRHPVIADALAAAEPVTPIHRYRGTANRLWHYERMRRWPERFVILGDAVCAFNPVYGQGMSTAAVAAETLDACLREQRRRPAAELDGLARRFQRRLARANADSWMLSTWEDLRYPTTTGMPVSAAIRLVHRYLDQVVVAATQDPATTDSLLQVMGMLARSTSLFAPRVLAAAARARVRSGPRWRHPAASLHSLPLAAARIDYKK
ncbi:MAG TPA: FAD-dependent monooxygenase [Pseudonocardiaceae bacterium]|nr:FAD-dependent monooxygenase [Pseudonocardiaceae bacterium]